MQLHAAVVGAYYGKLLAAAERNGRIASVPWEPALPVHTAWDLGIGDSTAIWFCQRLGRDVRLIDYYEAQIEAVLERLDVDTLRLAVELAEAVDVVRGYEDIKLDNIRRYLPVVDDLSTLLGIAVTRPAALGELTPQ